MRRILLLACVILASSCATDKKPMFDPSERAIPGKVIAKETHVSSDVASRLQTSNTAKMVGATVETLLMAGTGIVVVPSFDSSLPGKPTEYHVELESGKTLQLYNHYTGFAIGDCVTVFLGDNWQEYPPRMTSRGGSC